MVNGSRISFANFFRSKMMYFVLWVYTSERFKHLAKYECTYVPHIVRLEVIKPLQDDFTAWDYLVMCIYGLIVVISLFGNGLVFSVIIRTRYPTSTISCKKNICLGSHSNIITLCTKANVRFQSWDLFAMEKLVVNRVHPQKHNIYQLCWSTSTFLF